MTRVVASLAFAFLACAGCDTQVIYVGPGGADGGGGGAPSPSSGGSTCPVCPAGYTPVGTECIWYGGPRNGDFSEPGSWETDGAVFVDPWSLGGPGTARFPFDAICNGGGRLRQSFEMPTFACSEPLALELDAWNFCSFCFDGTTLDIDLDEGRHRQVVYEGSKVEICLGERAYGDTVTLSVSAWSTSCLLDTLELSVDNVDVFPADSEPTMTDDEPKRPFCPAPGTIVNGDFEAGMPGWETLSEDAEIGIGRGVGGTRGVRLDGSTCSHPRVQGTASLPMHENTPNPAVEMWVDGTGAQALVVSYGLDIIGSVTGAAARKVRLCVPRWAQGVAEPFGLALGADDIGCSPSGSEYRVDEIAIVSEPSCTNGAAIFDGGFESLAVAQDASSWWRGGGARASTEEAYEGVASLLLELGPLCEQAVARQTLTIPANAPKPALRFQYRTSRVSNSAVRVLGEVLVPSEDVWREHVICLDPETADTARPLELSLVFNGGACAGSPARVHFDAIEVLTSTDRPCKPAK